MLGHFIATSKVRHDDWQRLRRTDFNTYLKYAPSSIASKCKVVYAAEVGAPSSWQIKNVIASQKKPFETRLFECDEL